MVLACHAQMDPLFNSAGVWTVRLLSAVLLTHGALPPSPAAGQVHVLRPPRLRPRAFRRLARRGAMSTAVLLTLPGSVRRASRAPITRLQAACAATQRIAWRWLRRKPPRRLTWLCRRAARRSRTAPHAGARQGAHAVAVGGAAGGAPAAQGRALLGGVGVSRGVWWRCFALGGGSERLMRVAESAVRVSKGGAPTRRAAGRRARAGTQLRCRPAPVSSASRVGGAGYPCSGGRRRPPGWMDEAESADSPFFRGWAPSPVKLYRYVDATIAWNSTTYGLSELHLNFYC